MKKNFELPFYLFLPIIILIICFIIIWMNFYAANLKSQSIYAPGLYREQNLLYLDSEAQINDRVEDLLKQMTLLEKIGQMTLVEKNSIKDPFDVARYSLGGVMSGFGGKPFNNTPKDWYEMVNNYYQAGEYSRLGIPVLYGVDSVHGHSNVPGATVFPHFIGLGATKNPDLVKNIARVTAKEMAATGIYWNFAPNLDIPFDYRWGRVYETFGSDKDNVTTLGQAFINGFQYDKDNNFVALATAKHFVGNGQMTWGTAVNSDYRIDQGTTNISEAELRENHLAPFKGAVEANVGAVMIGLNTFDGKKLAANNYLITDVLKEELGFNGFVLSDWYGVYEISGSKYESAVIAINAGVDMVMLPFDYKIFIRDVAEAVEKGDISQTRIDDAARKILRAKIALGMFEKDFDSPSDFSSIGSAEHRDLARQAVRESLVIMKNNQETLPLKIENSSMLIAGSAANNMGRQTGAWTIEWQGVNGNVVEGTTILDGIKQLAPESSQIYFAENANFENSNLRAPIGIVVVGEKPYAEGVGDNPNPSLSDLDLETIEKMRGLVDKLVVIIVSGRPLDIKQYVDDWDAVVAAWLPGSEGIGCADILFGKYPALGTLPVEWEL